MGRVNPLWWVAIGAAFIWIDYVVGPEYPVLYVVPIMVAAWYSGRWAALGLACAVPAAHVLFIVFVWDRPEDRSLAVATTVFRAAVIAVMGLWFARLAEFERQMHRYVVKLEGLLPICSMCKSIRNEDENWEPLEEFISSRSDAGFTHGLCPSCLHTHYSVP